MSKSDSPSQGKGNGSPKAAPFTKGEGGTGYLAAKMREWHKRQRENDPNYTEPKRPPNMKELREGLRDGLVSVLEVTLDIARDAEHPKAVDAQKLIYAAAGLPTNVNHNEISGADGAPFRIVFTQDDTGVL